MDDTETTFAYAEPYREPAQHDDDINKLDLSERIHDQITPWRAALIAVFAVAFAAFIVWASGYVNGRP